ncbi:MAG TPA: glycosyltransferase family 39 protein [Solirubrobacteraceae bacterium]
MRPLRTIASDPRALLGLVVLVGVVLRLIDAGARINEDEGYTWLVATAPSAGAFLTRLAHLENTPPLFYLLLSVLPLSGEVWLRLPSIIAGALSIPVLYAVVRPLLGVRAALLAALGLAVAPFAVSYSDYSRGFMVAGLGVLVALLGAQRVAAGADRRWWWAYALGGAWALYSEYYAGIYLAAIVGALLVLGAPRRRDVLLFGAIPFLAFLPWVPELIRSVNDLGRTKLELAASTPSFPLVRDAIVPLFFGEHGAAASATLRSLQALLVAGVLAFACVRVWRFSSRAAFWLLCGVMSGAVLMYLLATALDTNIFRERYMTTVIPFAAASLAGGVTTLPWRFAVPAVATVLAVLGIAIVVARSGREYEPDVPAAIALVREHGAATILTNSSEVVFYGRRLHVVLDRPFGVGTGERTCRPRCVVIDDARFGGVRPGLGFSVRLGQLVIANAS